MHRPALVRPAIRPLAALLGAVLAAAACAALPSSSASLPWESLPSLRAVVSYEGAVTDVRGVTVVRSLPALGMAVVEADAAALVRLARTPGVRGVAPDSPLQLTGSTSGGTAVAAATGLGGQAGRGDAGRGVRVAVVDTGVSDTAALDRDSGRLVDAFDAGGATAPFDDLYGHGTFMASVVAGGPVDGAGGTPVGVAPGATVLVVRVADDDGSTSLSQVVAGLDWVSAHAESVDVANLSFSHTRPGAGYGADPLTDAVERVRDAGVTVVVSAGNDPDVVGDPGFAPKALTVGAARLGGADVEVAAFSGSGVVAGVVKPDVVANGVGVLGVLPAGSIVALAHPEADAGGGLWRGSGTSQAAAVTSGVVALLLEKQPDTTPAEVKTLLRAAARPLEGDRDGAGLLRVPLGRVDGADDDEPGTDPSGDDPTGEGSLDANSWSANSWSANSWSANSWSANSWSANSWSSWPGAS